MIPVASSEAPLHPDQARLEVRGLTRAFGEHYALVELDATWVGGEVCALLGPNGAGKSTLLNLLSTLMAATEGTLSLNGVTLTRQTAPSLRRQIGFVGHQTMIYEELSAFENLKFFAQLYEAWPSELRGASSAQNEWIMARLDEVGLQEAAHRPAGGFSRGMCQRLTLARALIPSPSVLLLDEPFTGLDREGIDQACELIAAQRDRGAIVIMSSHDLESTERLANRALILKRGRRCRFDELSGAQGGLLKLYQRSVNA